MKLNITEQGVLIPKAFFGESEEAELSLEAGQIIITPISKQTSIWDLGNNPVESDVINGGIHHDRYIYEQ